jgi:hypothetical protein
MTSATHRYAHYVIDAARAQDVFFSFNEWKTR